MAITGLGPHGERAVPADQVGLSDADADALRAQYPALAGEANATCGSKLPTELR